MNKLVPRNMSFVHVYYQKSTFRSQQKNELVGFVDFIGDKMIFLILFYNFLCKHISVNLNKKIY